LYYGKSQGPGAAVPEYIPRDPLLIFAFAQDIEMWMGYEVISD